MPNDTAIPFDGATIGAGVTNIGGVFTLGPPGDYSIVVSMEGSIAVPGPMRVQGFQNGVAVPRALFVAVTAGGETANFGGPFIITTIAVGETLEIRNTTGIDVTLIESHVSIVRFA